ncbi:MAG TPA: hypothetical protein PK466_06800 [Thermotogota bacterium]|nr:hypothetical protein [Thermotogota bacterium]
MSKELIQLYPFYSSSYYGFVIFPVNRIVSAFSSQIRNMKGYSAWKILVTLCASGLEANALIMIAVTAAASVPFSSNLI